MTPSRRLYPQEMAKIIQAQQASGQLDLSLDLDLSVTIGIVSYNRWRLTKRCLDSLYADQTYPFQVIIVDNGSEAETITFLQQAESAYPRLQVIYYGQNMGLTIARNQLAELAATDALCFLDNDIICHTGWLKEAIKVAVGFNAAFVAPLRLEVDGTVWGMGTDLVHTESGRVIEIARWFHNMPVEDVTRMMGGGECSGSLLSGGACMVRVRDFQQLGGFDEAYFLGFEDLDLSLRLAEASYEIWSAHRSWLTHDDQWQPQSETERAYVRNRFEMDRLEQQAAYFRSCWNADPLPAKYVVSIERRVLGKLGDEA